MRSKPGIRLLSTVSTLFFLGLPAMAAGPIDGAFIYLGAESGFDAQFQDVKNIPVVFDDLKSLGIKHLTVVWTMVKPYGSVCGDNRFSYVGGSWTGLVNHIQAILDQAAARGMTVRLGLTESILSCRDFYVGPNVAQVTAWNAFLAVQYELTWGKHPAFGGYYIPDEPSLAAPAWKDYTKAQVQAIRRISKAEIAIAPYLGPNPAAIVNSYSDIGYYAYRFVVDTGVTKLLYQDGVGASGLNLGRNPNQYSLETYLTGIRNYIGSWSLESDLELFNYGIYAAGPIARVNYQAWEARSGITSGITSWLPQEFMSSSPMNAVTDPEAKRLYSEYRALYGLGGKLYTGFSYTLQGKVNPYHPDRRTLNDSITGDGKNPFDSQWVEFDGSASMTVDMKSSVKIDYVSAHVMTDANPASGIYIPSSIQLSFSVDGSHWTAAATYPTPANRGAAGEYVIANTAPVGQTARYIQIVLANTHETMVSEITVSTTR